MRADLRAELGARPDPRYELVLPPGWVRTRPDQQALESMLAVSKERTRPAHLPDVYAMMKTSLSEAFEQMGRNGVEEYFMPGTDASSGLYIPGSMTASTLHTTPQQSLEQIVYALITDQGGKPLHGDKRTVRVSKQRRVRFADTTLMNHTITYLTPIPGSKRRRALQLVASFAHLPEAPGYRGQVEATEEMFDACVATLSWRPPAHAPA